MTIKNKPIRLNSAAATTVSLQNTTALTDGIKIDEDKFLIQDISVIQKGPALGHGFEVDDTMLKQVAEQINAKDKGVKARLTHPSFLEDGIVRMLGRVSNATVKGGKVRADLQLGEYASLAPGGGDMRAYVMSLAKEAPDMIGMSIVFQPGEFERQVVSKERPESTPSYEERGKWIVRYGRSQDTLAVDLVGEPAANRDGLLSQNHERINAMKLTKTQLSWLKNRDVDTEDEAAITAALEELSDEDRAEYDALTAKKRGAAPDKKSDDGSTQLSTAARPEGASNALSKEDAKQMAAEEVRLERERVTELNALGTSCPEVLGQDWANEHARKGTSLESARAEALDKLAKAQPVVKGLAFGMDRNLDTLGRAMGDALLARCGAGPKKPHERAKDFNGMRLMDMTRTWLESVGVNVRGLSADEMAKMVFNKRKLSQALGGVALGHSTSDFDYILADTMNKTLRTGYSLAPSTWAGWARRTTTSDFKQVSRVQLGAMSELLAIPEGAEYQFGTIGEARQTYTLAKYGRGFSITWEALINDDLSAFSRIPTAMGQAAKRLEDSLVYSTIFAANSGAGQTMGEDSLGLFASDHANVGTSAVLTVASIGQTGGLMRVQKAPGSADSNNGGDFLNLSPAHLLVPPALETTAMQLIASAVDPAKSNATPNPFAGKMSVIVEPRLAAVDANGWWLVASNSQIDTAEVCFLESEPNPVIEEEDTFIVDGRRYKVRHSLATAAIDYRGFCKNAGGS